MPLRLRVKDPLMRRSLTAAMDILGFSGAMDLALWLLNGYTVPGFVVSAFCLAEAKRSSSLRSSGS